MIGCPALAAAAFAAVLLCSAPAPAQTASVLTGGGATITPGFAITTRQDFVLGSILLTLPTMTRSLALPEAGFEQLRDFIRAPGRSAPITAAFVVRGDAGQSISIAVPVTIELVRLGGSQTIKMATRADFDAAGDAQTLSGTRNPEPGILAFNVGGRVLVGQDAVAGDYRGTLTATAQYN